jgi:hypothetical protein
MSVAREGPLQVVLVALADLTVAALAARLFWVDMAAVEPQMFGREAMGLTTALWWRAVVVH